METSKYEHGHIYRRHAHAVVEKSDLIVVDSRARGRGRPKLTLGAVIQKDLGLLNVSEQMALYRAQ